MSRKHVIIYNESQAILIFLQQFFNFVNGALHKMSGGVACNGFDLRIGNPIR